MSDTAEKRNGARCNHTAAIVCGFFNSGCYRPAETFNHSRDGIYIETDYCFRPGASVYIRLNHSMGSNASIKADECDGHPTVVLAEVKWCKELFNNGNSLYGVGLKYYHPVI